MSNEKIVIIGLGWLGLPLYLHLTKLKYLCIGSTTSAFKKEQFLSKNINAFVVEMNETTVEGEIEKCLQGDILILNTPPGLRRNPSSNYVKKIKNLIPYIEKSSVQKVLFISSTSVFKDEKHFPEIFNDTIPNSDTNAGIQIQNVEKLLLNNPYFETTILRFSGLVDEDRHPAQMMSKRPQVKNPNAPVNLIHRNDCIDLITAIIQQKKWGEVFNASYPKHTTKKEYYDIICGQKNLPKPNFDPKSTSRGKLINGKTTAEQLNFKYKYVI